MDDGNLIGAIKAKTKHSDRTNHCQSTIAGLAVFFFHNTNQMMPHKH
jgi:hypothetical protein